MIKHKKLILLIAIVSMQQACTVEPVPIKYGEHNCSFCEMTIVDTRYGSEIVTNKGKVYMFDAIECMANYIRKDMIREEDTELILFTSFENPDHLIEAREGIILHSKGIPSPMGMYLTGFGDRGEAEKMRSEHGGKLYEWNDLLNNFEQIRNTN